MADTQAGAEAEEEEDEVSQASGCASRGLLPPHPKKQVLCLLSCFQ